MLPTLLVIFLIVLVAVWYFVRNREIQSIDTRGGRRHGAREGVAEIDYWGVQVVVPEEDCCPQARELHGRRYPKNVAPTFPLPGCPNLACHCEGVKLPERRKNDRRKGVDRRGSLRFEPDKPDRRSILDRRKALNPWIYSR